MSIAFLCLVGYPLNYSFKTEQLKHARVASAHSRLHEEVDCLLKTAGIGPEKFSLYLRAFKTADLLEVWARSSNDDRFTLLKNYTITARSGKIGPKRKQGDLQVPEGFYHINRFNPWSQFHLSMGLNYPNKSDRILGNKSRLGGDIFIHGDEVTVGCLPLGDEMIEELYLLCIEATDRGQESIPINIFPGRMTEAYMRTLSTERHAEASTKQLWKSLEMAFLFFEKNKSLPTIGFQKDGNHTVY